MMKVILILMVFLGLVAFALVTATATPNDREEYEKYQKWKERERKAKCVYKDDRTEEEKLLDNCIAIFLEQMVERIGADDEMR